MFLVLPRQRCRSDLPDEGLSLQVDSFFVSWVVTIPAAMPEMSNFVLVMFCQRRLIPQPVIMCPFRHNDKPYHAYVHPTVALQFAKTTEHLKKLMVSLVVADGRQPRSVSADQLVVGNLFIDQNQLTLGAFLLVP